MPETTQNALEQIRQLKNTDDGRLFMTVHTDISMEKVLALVVEAIKELDDNKRGAPRVSGSLSHKPNNFSVSDMM